MGRSPRVVACCQRCSGGPPGNNCGTGVDLRRQRCSRGKQRIRISVGLPAFQRASEQAQVEPHWARFAKKRHGIVVRANAAGHPAVAKSPGIEERPQIRLAIFWLERLSNRETPRLVCPARKRCATQKMLNFLQCRPRRPDALPLHQYNRMIYIVDPIQRRKSTETEVTVSPEHG